MELLHANAMFSDSYKLWRTSASNIHSPLQCESVIRCCINVSHLHFRSHVRDCAANISVQPRVPKFNVTFFTLVPKFRIDELDIREIMSANSSPEPASRESPKRKRSHSPDFDYPQYDGAGDDPKLQYAYVEDVPSDAEHAFHSPDREEADGVMAKKRRIERPKRLNYAPYMTLRGHKRGIAAVKFSPDGKWIASCCKR